MQETDSRERFIKRIFVAVIIGLSIPLIALIFDVIYQEIPFADFTSVYRTNPIHYLLLIIPITSGIITYLYAHKFRTGLEEKDNIINNEAEKKNRIINIINAITREDAEITINIDEADEITQSLKNLKDYLHENKKSEEQRRKEDQQRNWMSEGLAKFSEILRSDNDNLETLSYNIISNLVNYLNANQGGFFILNDQDSEKYLELSASYAYERRKYSDKRLEWGEGLVGAVVLERKTKYMTDVPNQYLDITSGLGKATPRVLIIVPLIFNEEVHGAMEIASFNEFEQYQIDFLEKVAESIASTIATVKINVRTSRLLEATQEQAEALSSQEEEMRQNMEELQATQEEAARQAEKFISFTNSVNHTLIRAEYDTDGTLLYANTKFLRKLGYSSNSEVEGQHISMFINEKDKEWFFKIWDDLSKGGKHFEGDMKHFTKQGQDLWTMATYTCVRKDDGSVEKILFLAIDTTDQKKQSLDYEGQIKAINLSTIKVEYNPLGSIIGHNEEFLKTMQYTPADLVEKNVNELISGDENNKFNENWKKLLEGIPFQGQYLFRTKFNEQRWLRASFTPVYDMYNEVTKIIQISNDITNEKLMEIETQKQTKQLKEQEEKLRQSGKELSRRLDAAKAEMKSQFQEIETIKLRNERTLEGALDAIITINKNARVEFFNKAAEELWGFNRMDILNKDVKKLFSEEVVQKDKFVAQFVDPEKDKIIGTRQEVNITNSSGENVPVLFLLSEAKIGDDRWYTAFIQNIEVELF